MHRAVVVFLLLRVVQNAFSLNHSRRWYYNMQHVHNMQEDEKESVKCPMRVIRDTHGTHRVTHKVVFLLHDKAQSGRLDSSKSPPAP